MAREGSAVATGAKRAGGDQSRDIAALRAKVLGIELSTRVARREPSVEATRAWLDHIEGLCLEAAYHLTRIVGPPAGHPNGSSEVAAVDAGRVLAEVVERHRGLAQRSETTLDLRVDPDMPRVRVDEAVLADVLGSLVVSALHLSRGGVVRVAAGRAPRDGWVSVRVVAASAAGVAGSDDTTFDVPSCGAVIERLGGTYRAHERRSNGAATVSIALPGAGPAGS